jgi:hypothetical protein
MLRHYNGTLLARVKPGPHIEVKKSQFGWGSVIIWGRDKVK